MTYPTKMFTDKYIETDYVDFTFVDGKEHAEGTIRKDRVAITVNCYEASNEDKEDSTEAAVYLSSSDVDSLIEWLIKHNQVLKQRELSSLLTKKAQ